MSEALPVHAAHDVQSTSRQEYPPKSTSHLFPILLSALVPGTGHFVLGRRLKGTTLLVILVVILFGFWPLRLLRSYWGLIVLFWSWIILYIYSACSTHLTRHPETQERPSPWGILATVPLVLFTLTALGAGVTRVSGFRIFTVPSTAMEKTIQRGDRIVVELNTRKPERGEVIVFYRDRLFIIKRAVAVGGDVIQGIPGIISVNGKELAEPYVQHAGPLPPLWMNTFGPVIVPSGKAFVMGDNRDVSLDSRSPKVGFVDDSAVVGRPLYIFDSNRTGSSIK